MDYITKQVSSGGRPADSVYFTCEAFKRLCMMSQTSRGNSVRNYYIKLEELVVQFVEMQSRSALQDLSDAVVSAERERDTARSQLALSNTGHNQALRNTKHLSILESYDKLPVVYIALLEELDGSAGDVYKIGRSDNIRERSVSLQTRFGNCTYVYAIVARMNDKFEKFLHGHNKIHCHRYTHKINGLNTSTETFQLTQSMVETIKKVMKREVTRFNGFSPEQELRVRELAVAESESSARAKEAQNESDRIMLDSKAHDRAVELEIAFQRHVDDLYKTVKELEQELIIHPLQKSLQDRYAAAQQSYQSAYLHQHNISSNISHSVNVKESQEESETVTELTTAQQHAEEARVAHLKHRQVSRGQWIQRYNTNLELIDHFDGPTAASRVLEGEHKTGTASPQALTKAIQNNTIYKGYRWAEVSRKGDPTVSQTIPPTVHVHVSGGGLIAIYTRDGQRIEVVKANQKDARDYLHVKANAAISLAVNSGLTRKCQGCLLSYWDDVPETLKNVYLQTNDLPSLPTRKGCKVLQLDTTTKQVIRRWDNVTAVTKHFHMSVDSVKKACDGGEARAGFLWSWFDEPMGET